MTYTNVVSKHDLYLNRAAMAGGPRPPRPHRRQALHLADGRVRIPFSDQQNEKEKAVLQRAPPAAAVYQQLPPGIYSLFRQRHPVFTEEGELSKALLPITPMRMDMNGEVLFRSNHAI